MVFSEDINQRFNAANLPGREFIHMDNRNQAWQDIKKRTRDEEPYVRWVATGATGMAFSRLPNK
jgi:hypothetical protein